MKGNFFGVGTGPGSSEDLTLKALKILDQADTVVLPNSDKEKCVAYKIVKKSYEMLDKKNLIFCDFPMTKDPAVLKEAHSKCAEKICNILSSGKDVAFLTIGDPCVYSTFGYIQNLVEAAGFKTEIISGVTSFCAAAKELGISLSEQDEEIHIIPGSYKISDAFNLSGTLVFMKSGKFLAEIKKFLLEKSLEYEFEFYAVSNAGMENQQICKDLNSFCETAGYLTVVIVKNIKRTCGKAYEFFQNTKCENFPCHKIENENNFNCLFCYCPFYFLGEKCGGNFYITSSGKKSCKNCSYPHEKSNYSEIIERLKKLM